MAWLAYPLVLAPFTHRIPAYVALLFRVPPGSGSSISTASSAVQLNKAHVAPT